MYNCQRNLLAESLVKLSEKYQLIGFLKRAKAMQNSYEELRCRAGEKDLDLYNLYKKRELLLIFTSNKRQRRQRIVWDDKSISYFWLLHLEMITFQYHIWHTFSPNNSMALMSQSSSSSVPCFTRVECIEIMENVAGGDTEACLFHFPFQF